METQQNFRTAFNGFNREDVVHYIEHLNAKHAAQINTLTAELEYLQAQTPVQPLCITNPTEDSSVVEQQAARIRELFDRCKELEAEVAALRSGAIVPPVSNPAQELEAYRRAERAERLARERAENIHNQINGVLADASARVEETSAHIDTVSQQVMDNLEELRCAVLCSKKVLKEAASSMGSLRPEQKEE